MDASDAPSRTNDGYGPNLVPYRLGWRGISVCGSFAVASPSRVGTATDIRLTVPAQVGLGTTYGKQAGGCAATSITSTPMS